MRVSCGLAACISAMAIALNGCAGRSLGAPAAVTGGDAHRGAAAIAKYGCGSCHVIPGISGARGLTGPPLTGVASRLYIGGVITNTPEHVVRWILDPTAIDDKTAMPNLGVTEQDAKDIAAYVYTLR